VDLLAFLQLPAIVQLALLVRDLGFVVYGGGICVFALMALLSERFGGLPTAHVLRTFRGVGPGLGLALGATVFGALTAHLGATGSFSWSLDSATGGMPGLLAWVSFLGLWASNIKLEVWTLEPLRKLDPEGAGVAGDAAALDQATRTVVRHLSVQAGLVATVIVLARLAA